MWIGPGGIIAVVLAGWSWAWAARRTPGRPPAAWLGTVVALVAVELALPILTTVSWLVVGYAEAARALSSVEKGVLLDALRPSYGPLLWGLVAVGLTVAGLLRTRGRWGVGGPGRGTLGLLAAEGLLLGGAAIAVAAFHLVFVSGGPAAVSRQGARIATEVLLGGGAMATLALLVALGWLVARLVARLRGQSEVGSPDPAA